LLLMFRCPAERAPIQEEATAPAPVVTEAKWEPIEYKRSYVFANRLRTRFAAATTLDQRDSAWREIFDGRPDKWDASGMRWMHGFGHSEFLEVEIPSRWRDALEHCSDFGCVKHAVSEKKSVIPKPGPSRTDVKPMKSERVAKVPAVNTVLEEKLAKARAAGISKAGLAAIRKRFG